MKPCRACGAALENRATTCTACNREQVDPLASAWVPTPPPPRESIWPFLLQELMPSIGCSMIGAFLGLLLGGIPGAIIGAFAGFSFGLSLLFR